MPDTPPKVKEGKPPEPGGRGPIKDPDAVKRPRGRPPGSGSNFAKLETGLGEFFGAFALIFAVRGDMHCAAIITEGAPKLAKSYTDLAKVNPGVKKVLESITSGSAWGGVVLTTVSVALPIAQHHSETLARIPNPFNLGANVTEAARVATEPGPLGDWKP